MRYVDLEVGPGWVVSTRSDAAQLWQWLRERRHLPLGLDLESNGKDQFDPAYRARLCQFSDGHESWMIQLERSDPGGLSMLDVMRTCIRSHDYWVAHFAEADIRFAERAAPGSIRLDQIAPHVADTQPVLAYYDPRTVTGASKKERIDVRIRRPRGLKWNAEFRLPEGKILSAAEDAMHDRFAELSATAGPDPEDEDAVEFYRELINQYGLTGTRAADAYALAQLGVSSSKKTSKGKDSWTAATLTTARDEADGETRDVLDAILALRRLRGGPSRSGKELDTWGFAHISDDDETYLRYGGLDPLMTIRLWHKLTTEIRSRGQWPALRQALKLQWHIDLMTFRGKLVDPEYARWLDDLYAGVVTEHAQELSRHGILRSASGPAIGRAFNALGLHSDRTTSTGGESWDRTVLAGLVKDPATPPAAGELATTIRIVRSATKFRAAYVSHMLIALRRDGRVHCSMRAIGTVTGRQSAQRPALQQQPKRTDQRIRPAFCAPPGWVYVSSDVAQGEPRMMAARSGDRNLQRDIAAPGGLYGALARLAFGSNYNPAEGKLAGTLSFRMRDGSKITYLSRCYGAGIVKLAETLDVTVNAMTDIKNRWDREYSTLTEYEKRLNRQPHIILDSGRIVPLWDRYIVRDDSTLVLGDKPSRNGLNYDTQGSLADYVNNCVEKVIDAGWSWALSMLVHDEIVCVVSEDKAEECRRMLEEIMTSTYRGVPMLCEATIDGRTWMPQKNTGFHPAELEGFDDD